MKHRISTPLRIEEAFNGGRKAFFEADGTRYTAWAYRVRNFKLQHLGHVEDGWLVICGLNRLSYLFQKGGMLHWSYIGEKFRLNQTDAESMAYVIGTLIGRETVEYEVEEME